MGLSSHITELSYGFGTVDDVRCGGDTSAADILSGVFVGHTHATLVNGMACARL